MDETKCIKIATTECYFVTIFILVLRATHSDHSDTKTKQLQLTKSAFSSPSESFIGKRYSQSLSPSLPLCNG